MATGDDALAAGMDILTGNELANTLDTEENKTRDYIAQRTNAVTPLEKGGTGATTASGARAALGVNLAAPGSVEVNKIPSYTGAGRLISNPPSSPADVATKGYVDAGWAADPMWLNNLNVQGQLNALGQLYALAATPATSGYTIAYINSDGRLSKGASSERYKENITEIDPTSLGDIFPQLVSYVIRDDTAGAVHVGHIAEHLQAAPDQAPFVVHDSEGRPDSIDFIALLLAQTAQLHQRITELEARA